MWLRVFFSGELAAADSVPARRVESRSILIDDQECSGHIRPRWGGRFPAQPQVAAWARGSVTAHARPRSEQRGHEACWAALMGLQAELMTTNLF